MRSGIEYREADDGEARALGGLFAQVDAGVGGRLTKDEVNATDGRHRT